MASFIILYNSKRLDNLGQTLRFLKNREEGLLDTSELILACQDSSEQIDSPFKNTRQINLGWDSYRKTKMTNMAVQQSTQDILVLLDSDRVLPKNYFTNNIAKIKKGQIVTTECLFKVCEPYPDDKIDTKNIGRMPDFRSKECAGRKKNLFAGNTILYKSDYWDMGGYDEQFDSYGFADTDLSRTAVEKGYEIVFNQDEELHLWHKLEISWKGEEISVDQFQIIVGINALKYLAKWKLRIDHGIYTLMGIITELWDIYPKELQEEYLEAKKLYAANGPPTFI